MALFWIFHDICFFGGDIWDCFRLCSTHVLLICSDTFCSNKIWYMLIHVKMILNHCPTNTPRVSHVETTRKRPFPRPFNVEYTWYVSRVIILFSNNWLLKEVILWKARSSRPEVFYKIGVLENFAKCTGTLGKPQACNFI